MSAQLKSILSQFSDTRVYNLYLNVSKEEGQPFIEGNTRRVLCTFQNGICIHTSLMPWPEGYFILINQKLKSQLKTEIGEEVVFTLERDQSEYGMEMPEELLVLLDQDNVGSSHFQQLTPGKQRNLIYIVNSVKNLDGRMNRALAIVDHLNDFNGKLDFKQLNIKLKEYNQRGKLNR